MGKRTIMAIALAASLAAILASGSLAYFTASKDVTERFMVASYDSGGSGSSGSMGKPFSIKVVQTDHQGKETEAGLTYTDMISASVMAVDPAVVNTGEYSEWARMKITLTKASAWKTALLKYGIEKPESIFGGVDPVMWEFGETTEDTQKDTITFVYYLTYRLEPGAKATLMTSLSVPGRFDSEDMSSIDHFSMNFAADAIQSNGTGNTSKNAFARYWDK